MPDGANGRVAAFLLAEIAPVCRLRSRFVPCAWRAGLTGGEAAAKDVCMTEPAIQPIPAETDDAAALLPDLVQAADVNAEYPG